PPVLDPAPCPPTLPRRPRSTLFPARRSSDLTYFADSYLIPNARIGIRKNLAGSELTYLNLGTTLFGVANLDLGYSLDSTEIDGSSTPRGLAISFGFEEKF